VVFPLCTLAHRLARPRYLSSSHWEHMRDARLKHLANGKLTTHVPQNKSCFTCSIDSAAHNSKDPTIFVLFPGKIESGERSRVLRINQHSGKNKGRGCSPGLLSPNSPAALFQMFRPSVLALDLHWNASASVWSGAWIKICPLVAPEDAWPAGSDVSLVDNCTQHITKPTGPE